MKKTLFAVLFGFVLILAACGGGGDDGDASETAAGEDLYQQNCAACHGGDLSGGAGPSLENAGDDFDHDEVVSIILEGYGGMAPVDVSEDEASDIADFVTSQ
ncbi:c-type cytochrome [Alkalibacillus aidingensis]|uniref:c-type cytochrome n=1 Tax=Alkalibacillus aidingensis TaxID=2747607 RepID=UPI001660757C|nr:c-type cytochrome [Alkalibacillus aidingensis]